MVSLSNWIWEENLWVDLIRRSTCKSIWIREVSVETTASVYEARELNSLSWVPPMIPMVLSISKGKYRISNIGMNCRLRQLEMSTEKMMINTSFDLFISQVDVRVITIQQNRAPSHSPTELNLVFSTLSFFYFIMNTCNGLRGEVWGARWNVFMSHEMKWDGKIIISKEQRKCVCERGEEIESAKQLIQLNY